MDVVCFEYATGGGGYEDPSVIAADSPFLREGAWMLAAVVDDLLACPGVHVKVLLDQRVETLGDRAIERTVIGSQAELYARLAERSREARFTLLIAPECGGVLENLTALVEQAGGRLLCPNLQVVRLAADKHATALWLSERGVATPEGVFLAPGAPLPSDFSYPAVLKPVDGAGSYRIRQVASWREDERAPIDGCGWRLETFREGRAASVLVCNTDYGSVALPASWQHLTEDGSFTYCGGTSPIPEPWNERARELALRAAAALPLCRGYVGFDLVLGTAADGRDDVVIEVNPRLTTSYIGVRQVVRENLMSPLLESNSLRPLAAWTRRRHAADPVRFG